MNRGGESMDLQGKVALVTGGGTGIGRAAARRSNARNWRRPVCCAPSVGPATGVAPCVEESLDPCRSLPMTLRSCRILSGAGRSPGSRSSGLGSSWASRPGNRSSELADRTQHDASTVWRLCRRYEDSGLPGLLAPPRRPGRPARISPPPARPDRRTGLPGAGRQGPAHHPLVE